MAAPACSQSDMPRPVSYFCPRMDIDAELCFAPLEDCYTHSAKASRAFPVRHRTAVLIAAVRHQISSLNFVVSSRRFFLAASMRKV